MLNRSAIKCVVFILTLSITCASFAQGDGEVLPPDVRLVIDVSGSMKQNDPNNLRQPAVDLLVQLLPDNSKAGIWTFGRWVNMLVKHQNIDDAWREDAIAKSTKINSVGLFTNIGEALEKAAYDAKTKSGDYHSSIILLTDGMVDIDKDPDKNAKEWRRIVDEVLPKLKAAGFTIHTIALSDNADTDLLNKLSLSTDGIAEVAHTADDLMKIFLKAFDVAAPAEQVPLDDNGFVIDSSVEEFTALIFRDKKAQPTQLKGPDDIVFTAQSNSPYVNWYEGPNYDLITVKQPLEGQWYIASKIQPDSRITVVSNLNLRVKPLPNNVFRNRKESVSFLLQEDGKPITDDSFLSLMDMSASMLAGKDEFDLREIWKTKIPSSPSPSNDRFSFDLPAFDKEGIYQLSLIVDGKSFVREFTHQFTTRQPFGADIKQVFVDGNAEYLLTTRAYGGDVLVNKTQIVATITYPDERKKIRPLEPTERDTWEVSIRPEMEGQFVANIKIRGENKEGEKFDLNLDPIKFNYSIEEGFVEKEEAFFEETPTPSPVPSAEPSPAQSEAPEQQNEEEIESDGIAPWMLYGLLGFGNLLIIALGYIAFRKILGSNKDDVLEEFSDENVNKTVEEEVPEEIEDFEEEPPMEDIDPSSDEPEELATTFDEPSMDDGDVGDDDETFAMDTVGMDDGDIEEIQDETLLEEAPAEPEEPAEPPMEYDDAAELDEDDPMDDLDDLDQMAVEAEEAQEAQELDQGEIDDGEEDEEEDMVAAMLKAQGLDLAEDELDDAISNLIDELENDDSLMDDDFDDK